MHGCKKNDEIADERCLASMLNCSLYIKDSSLL